MMMPPNAVLATNGMLEDYNININSLNYLLDNLFCLLFYYSTISKPINTHQSICFYDTNRHPSITFYDTNRHPSMSFYDTNKTHTSINHFL